MGTTKGNAISALSVMLGALIVVFMPIRGAGLEMGFNEDITNNTGQDAYDFHLEGTLKSATPPRQLNNFCSDWPRGSIPGFDWKYDGGTITHLGGKLYHYSGGWSGRVPVGPDQTIHIGKYFDETCENIFVDLRGWWTDREGRKINPEAGTREGEIWLSDVALLGFEIVDNIPARLEDPNLPQTVMLQNATNHTILIEWALVAVTDVRIPLEQLVSESELLDSLDGWRDFPWAPVLAPGENWTFDLSEVDLEIQPNQNTVIRAGILDLDAGYFHFYAGKCRAHSASDPMVRVDTLNDWGSLLGRPDGQYPRINPVPWEVFQEMVRSDPDWPPEYQEAAFATPQLDARTFEDDFGQVEPALYMRWGPADATVEPGVNIAASWDYDYGIATDLSDVELEFSILAPQEATRFAVNLIDESGNWREFIWRVGGPGEVPPRRWTSVRVDPSNGDSDYPLEVDPFEGGGEFELKRVTTIRFNENIAWNGDFPLDDGWVWNVWADLEVRPAPRVSVRTLDDWRSLLDPNDEPYPRIDPVDASTFAAMVESSEAWPPEYRDAAFATAELEARTYEDESGQVEPALYMRWGPRGEAVQPGVNIAASWDYSYPTATDLSDVELEFSILAPQEATRFAVNLIDENRNWREFVWRVGGPDEVPPRRWTAVRLNPSNGGSDYPLEVDPFEAGEGFELNRVRAIRFNENIAWNGDFPLDNGWVWNVWADLEVRWTPRVSVSTLDDWGSLLDPNDGPYPRINPVDASTFAAMVESSDAWPPEYRNAVFNTPQLDAREYEDESGQVEPALYMRWGPEGGEVLPGVYNAASWDYDYGIATDLRSVELEFSILAPQTCTFFAVNLIDENGSWREFIWHVGGPGEVPPRRWTTVRVNPSNGMSNYPLEVDPFEGGGSFELDRVTTIRFNENIAWNEDFPLVNGWVWNVWADLELRPVEGQPNILLTEDFEGLSLGPNVDEALAGDRVWTDIPPDGWVIDESGVPGIGDPSTDGVTEWAGWAFANKEWWIEAAEDQNRSQFELGRGTVAVADPDEWDDADHPGPISEDPYDTWLSTPAIDISGCDAGTVQLKFDSSWRPEFDSDYHQTANITASFDGSDPIEVLRWESDPGSPNFKPDATNETVTVDVANPEGATSMVLTFGLFDAGNDWWWAIDNIEVLSGIPKPLPIP